jgi:Spy/CpxP family protein refolding chaperone
MVKKTLPALGLALMLAPALAAAQSAASEDGQRPSPEQRRERWQNMSPEERATRREAARERFRNLPPEQQEKIRERIRQRREERGRQQSQ